MIREDPMRKRSLLLACCVLLCCLATSERVRPAPAPQGLIFRGKPLRAWIAALQDRNPRTRRQAAEALAVIGPEARDAAPGLCDVLQDDDKDVREAAMEALSEIRAGTSEVVAALTRRVREKTDRYPALRSLCRCGPAGVAVVVAALQDSDRQVRSAAVVALTHGIPPRAALPGLLAALGEDNEDIRRNAIYALAGMGGGAREAVRALYTIAMGDKKGDLRRLAADALLAVGARQEGIKALITVLADDNREYAEQERAAISLAAVGPEAKAAIPALEAAVKGKSKDLRVAAAMALWHIDRREEALETLAREWQDAQGWDGLVVAAALMEVGEGALPFLVKWLTAPPKDLPGARPLAILLLSHIGPAPAEAAGPLSDALQDRDVPVRAAAAEALGAVGAADPAVVTALIRTLRDPDARVRQAAARSLAVLGKGSPAVAAVLRESGENLESIALLWKIEGKPKTVVGVLTSSLQMEEHDDDDRAVQAAQLLGRIGPGARTAVPALMAALHQGTGALRREASETLGKIGNVPAEGLALLQAAAEDDNDLVRASAARGLGLLGTAARPAVPVLAGRLRDKNPLVRRTAARALRRIDPVRWERLALPPTVGPDEPVYADLSLRAWIRAARQEHSGPTWMNPDGSFAALAVLHADGSPEAVGALAHLLADRREEVRQRAAAALADLGTEAKSAIPVIRPLLRARHPAIRRAAAEALAGIDPSVSSETLPERGR
jgi:HEAT repeat protein